PTAGLHFTPELIDGLKDAGIQFADVTLHVGLDTFSPVNEEHPEDHIIHKEWCMLTHTTAEIINQTKKNGARVIAVGTTSVRTIESAYNECSECCVKEFSGSTGLYIIPGYKYKVVDAMITNFHLPKSTLLMMVSAFTGRDRILDAYEVAKQEGYRFFSFGDAMLIL
ncbi:MAG: S-adenosylmethionine:tRNA ribosyltransferase-isomerase, partial [Anaerolineaceae bacterium]|nr:S-adenosylmethionine:tRNA ribosyltransferase-isomerase [Anaerolineaceae bacterium]